jgi:microcystin-dependent protein
MSEPFLSELKLFSFNFPPKGWAFCNGQLLPINQNQALFALLGTTYGGNGQTNFALPNLRGRAAISFSSAHALGEAAGSTSVTITQQTMPQHLHFAQARNVTATAGTATATSMLAVSTPQNIYAPASNLVAMDPGEVTIVGGSQPHNNMMPYLVLNWCIALQGIFPSRN